VFGIDIIAAILDEPERSLGNGMYYSCLWFLSSVLAFIVQSGIYFWFSFTTVGVNVEPALFL